MLEKQLQKDNRRSKLDRAEQIEELKAKAEKELSSGWYEVWLSAVKAVLEEYKKNGDERLLGYAEVKLAEMERNIKEFSKLGEVKSEDYNAMIESIKNKIW